MHSKAQTSEAKLIFKSKNASGGEIMVADTISKERLADIDEADVLFEE